MTSMLMAPEAELRSALEDPFDDPTFQRLMAAKPDGDAVPRLVWWLVGETLRTSRVVTDALLAGDVPTSRMLGEAMLFNDLAIEELADAAGTARMAHRMHLLGAPPQPVVAAAALRRTTQPLARMLVTTQPTSAAALADALGRHRRALERARVTA